MPVRRWISVRHLHRFPEAIGHARDGAPVGTPTLGPETDRVGPRGICNASAFEGLTGQSARSAHAPVRSRRAAGGASLPVTLTRMIASPFRRLDTSGFAPRHRTAAQASPPDCCCKRLRLEVSGA